MDKIEELKKYIIYVNSNDFVHEGWFIKYHLNIVEDIALELCKQYPKVDKTIVLALVWLHDYPKILGIKNETRAIAVINAIMHALNFDIRIRNKILKYFWIFERKVDLQYASIEVQIVSSADGASHMIGPFYPIFWREHPDWSIEEIMKENRRKLKVDWDKKITLPEVKVMMRDRYLLLSEQFRDVTKK